jgi:hypothetical protein
MVGLCLHNWSSNSCTNNTGSTTGSGVFHVVRCQADRDTQSCDNIFLLHPTCPPSLIYILSFLKHHRTENRKNSLKWCPSWDFHHQEIPQHLWNMNAHYNVQRSLSLNLTPIQSNTIYTHALCCLRYTQWNLYSSFLSGVWKRNNGSGKTIDAGAIVEIGFAQGP